MTSLREQLVNMLFEIDCYCRDWSNHDLEYKERIERRADRVLALVREYIHPEKKYFVDDGCDHCACVQNLFPPPEEKKE